jgi:hypothetical protein
MLEIQEISTNLLQGGPGLRTEEIHAMSDETFLCGGRYATLIEPEFRDIYQSSVAILMTGLVSRDATMTTLPSGGKAYASIYGFRNNECRVDDEQTSHLIVPSIARAFLSLIDGDPDDALHAYHRRLIDDTNKALGSLASPYRLAPLPADSP